VTRGPGSFTGVRAGIAAARGLALGCGAEVVGAGSLEVMAQACLDRLSGAERERGFLIAHDARRGELYVQRFSPDGKAVSAPALASLAEAPILAAQAGVVAGSGAQLLAREAAQAGVEVLARLPDLLPDAAHLARVASHLSAPAGAVGPLYLRPPDARPQTDKALARV
jgi:tRNA threonylcarbamoyl adenosine modification protein YeaZ